MSEIWGCVERPRKGKSSIIEALMENCLDDDFMDRNFDPYWDKAASEKAGHPVYSPFHFKPEDVYTNYYCRIKGVNCLTNDELHEYIRKEIKKQSQKKIVCIDEAGQFYPALNYHDKKQIEEVRSFQQYPKLYKFLFYTSAPGKSNGVDPNLRQITKYILDDFTYHHNRERIKDYIELTINNDDEDYDEQVRIDNIARYQRNFDSRRPVK